MQGLHNGNRSCVGFQNNGWEQHRKPVNVYARPPAGSHGSPASFGRVIEPSKRWMRQQRNCREGHECGRYLLPVILRSGRGREAIWPDRAPLHSLPPLY